jgi:hypothetical protein
MGDMAEVFRDWGILKRERKEKNTLTAMAWIKDNNIEYQSKNGGAHIILNICATRVDLWPSTNKAKIHDRIIGNAMGFIKKMYKKG